MIFVGKKTKKGLSLTFIRCILSIMAIFLHNFFHRETNDKTEGGLVGIPRRVSGRFRKRGSVRQTSLFPPIDLPEADSVFARNILVRGRFHEASLEHQDVDLRTLANILRCGYGTLDGQQQHRRTVPSLGERYPLGVYVFLFEPLGVCRPGLYRYDVSGHRLEPLQLKLFSAYERQSFAPAEWPLAARVLICLTIFFPLSVEGYGSRGYRYRLFEAGHAGQNMVLAAGEADKTLIPLEGIHEGKIEGILGVNTEEERVLSAWCL